jgi:hypothetical protein
VRKLIRLAIATVVTGILIMIPAAAHAGITLNALD